MKDLTWNKAFHSVSMTRPPWVQDTKIFGLRYQAHFPKGPAYSTDSPSGCNWVLVNSDLNPWSSLSPRDNE